jgi:hypothetical protein
VLQYFDAIQIGINNSTLQDALARFEGGAVVAGEGSSFTKWNTPNTECMFGFQDAALEPRYGGRANRFWDGEIIKAQRRVDIGDIRISGVELGEVTIPKDSSNWMIVAFGVLSPGSYWLQNTEASTRVEFRQALQVLEMGSQIQVYSGTLDPQALPSPQLGQPEDLVTVQKLQDLVVTYTAPAETDFVRLQISDGSKNPESTVVCYTESASFVSVPAGALNYFRSTDDGLMFVDFVKSDIDTSIPRITESLVRSVRRHLHGTIDLYLDNSKQTFKIGTLRIQ